MSFFEQNIKSYHPKMSAIQRKTLLLQAFVNLSEDVKKFVGLTPKERRIFLNRVGRTLTNQFK